MPGVREMGALMKKKYLLGVASAALSIAMMSSGAWADPTLDAVMQRLDALEKATRSSPRRTPSCATRFGRSGQGHGGARAGGGARSGRDRSGEIQGQPGAP